MLGSEKAFKLTQEMLDTAREQAARFGVNDKLSDEDQLLGFLINNVKLSPVDAVTAYFAGGSSDARAVLASITESGNLGQKKRVCEFAAGFGRVTRHLKTFLPENDFSTSDIHREACSLIENDIGVKASLSNTDPSKLNVDGLNDFIFVLSLFSHLSNKTFGPWLSSLYALLSPGGTLLLTTHGEAAMRLTASISEKTSTKTMALAFGSSPIRVISHQMITAPPS